MEVLVVCAVTFFVTAPLLVLVHELGHGLAVIRAGRRPVILVGRQPPLVKLDLRRMALRLHPMIEPKGFLTQDLREGSPVGGLCIYDSRGLTVSQRRWITAAGPRADLIFALIAGSGAALIGDRGSVLFWILGIAFVSAFVEAIFNLIPRSNDLDQFTDGAMLAMLGQLDPGLVLTPEDAEEPDDLPEASG